ncbi:MAG: TIGR00725 family protein [Actinomycetota bacterium]|jgi:uncharacterized protein (TIGR00725 family)|nr:TIGR00725 family protein [Actinomycetota bacterium]
MHTIIGVMGGSEADQPTLVAAEKLGALIAREGWVLLSGGRSAGVMEASARGAQNAGGLTLGILPDTDASRASAHIDIPVLTGMGDARNAINALTGHVMIALRGGSGTISEVALALSAERPVIMLDCSVRSTFPDHYARRLIRDVTTPQEAIEQTRTLLK